jgi:molybdopterin adenylyltransferase
MSFYKHEHDGGSGCTFQEIDWEDDRVLRQVEVRGPDSDWGLWTGTSYIGKIFDQLASSLDADTRARLPDEKIGRKEFESIWKKVRKATRYSCIGIVTVSDRASQGVYEDLGGPAIRDCLRDIISSPYYVIPRLIPDERKLIEKTLKELCDDYDCCLVVTTGGTGPAKRDVTPEATEAVCDKLLDGFGELMRSVSLKVVPTAILSRQIAGVRGSSLIINLPGKPSAIRDCLLAVFPAIPYCIDLIEGPYLTTNEAVVKAFRPKK